MKKQNILRAALALAALGLAATAAYATVGGPAYIHSFSYNPADESVYYVYSDFGGRGCPPELHKISLASGATEVVYSCARGEAEGADARADIAKILEPMKPLTQLSLRANDIEIDVDHVRAEPFTPGSDEIVRRHFTATAYQLGEEVAEFPIVGCNLEQPFLFEGYAIPGYEKKIVALLSTKSSCFEGGYTGESLHVIGGVDGLDRRGTATEVKGPSALVANEGTLVVYEADELGAGGGEPVNEDPDAPDAVDTTDGATGTPETSGAPQALAVALLVALALALVYAVVRAARRG